MGLGLSDPTRSPADGALELADAHGVRISMNIGPYHAAVRRRAASYAVRCTLRAGGQARDRALAQAWTSPCSSQKHRSAPSSGQPYRCRRGADPCDPRANAGPLQRATGWHQRDAEPRQSHSKAHQTAARRPVLLEAGLAVARISGHSGGLRGHAVPARARCWRTGDQGWHTAL